MFTSFIFQRTSALPEEMCILVIFLWTFIKKKDKFIDNSFTHFGTLPEEILSARRGVRLLSSTCHIGWVSPTSQGVAKWQLPMSAKMKPQEGKKKKQDGSKFHTPKYIKVTPVSIASKRRNGNCSFLQLRVGLWRGFSGEIGWKVEHRKLWRVTNRKNYDNEKHIVNHRPFGFMTAESK